MLFRWEPDNEDDIPPYQALKRMRDNQLSAELGKILGRSHANVRCAVKKMIAYVAMTRSMDTKDIQLVHLTQPDVGNAALAYKDSWKALSKILQHFLEIQEGVRTIPIEGRKYLHYHPLLIQWISEKQHTTRHGLSHARSIIMQFLFWTTTHHYYTYTPHEFPVVFIDRDLLLIRK